MDRSSRAAARNRHGEGEGEGNSIKKYKLYCVNKAETLMKIHSSTRVWQNGRRNLKVLDKKIELPLPSP